jgi:uncharacterized flavoprotein (TIGR03862 family)
MAAEVLAAAGLAVTIYEHMPSVGRKLLLAGRGGLNITHNEPFDDLLTRYGSSSAQLEAALHGFTPAQLRTWCAGLGESTFVGSSGRVFPASFRATPLLRAWLTRLAGLGVAIETGHRWSGWGETNRQTSTFVQRVGGAVEVRSDVTLFALGGGSWPRVGSDGGWVTEFRRAGIDVRELRPANCGVRIEWSKRFHERCGGLPLKNIAISVDGVSTRGDAMITRGGLEGGPIYAHSAATRNGVDRDGRCVLSVDFQPDLTVTQIAGRLAARRPKDSVSAALRKAVGLPTVSIALLREITSNRLPDDPDELAVLIKAAPMIVHETMPIARAISSAGGVALTEVDDSFMLRSLPGTFVSGEMLDWEAPTGGYLLQASFSTAVAAAEGAIRWLASEN